MVTTIHARVNTLPRTTNYPTFTFFHLSSQADQKSAPRKTRRCAKMSSLWIEARMYHTMLCVPSSWRKISCKIAQAPFNTPKTFSIISRMGTKARLNSKSVSLPPTRVTVGSALEPKYEALSEYNRPRGEHEACFVQLWRICSVKSIIVDRRKPQKGIAVARRSDQEGYQHQRQEPIEWASNNFLEPKTAKRSDWVEYYVLLCKYNKVQIWGRECYCCGLSFSALSARISFFQVVMEQKPSHSATQRGVQK